MIEGFFAGACAVGIVRMAVKLSEIEVVELILTQGVGQHGNRAVNIALLCAHNHHCALPCQHFGRQHRLMLRIIGLNDRLSRLLSSSRTPHSLRQKLKCPLRCMEIRDTK